MYTILSWQPQQILYPGIVTKPSISQVVGGLNRPHLLQGLPRNSCRERNPSQRLPIDITFLKVMPRAHIWEGLQCEKEYHNPGPTRISPGYRSRRQNLPRNLERPCGGMFILRLCREIGFAISADKHYFIPWKRPFILVDKLPLRKIGHRRKLFLKRKGDSQNLMSWQ